MPASPYVICLEDAARLELEAVSRRATAPFRLVQRARIVLLAVGLGNSMIARQLGICEDTARKWRRQYCEGGLAGLAGAPRPGRPRTFTARAVAEVKALAREAPEGSGKPLARWTCPELARQAAAAGSSRRSQRPRCAAGSPTMPSSPGSTVPGSLPGTRTSPSRAAGSSTFTSAPGKEGTWARMSTCSAQTRSPASRHAREPGSRCRPPRGGRCAESEYVRCGTLAYLAAYDVHRARVFGRCEPTTGIKPFTALADQVMTTEPYASARRVFWVVDNGASHRNWAAADRMRIPQRPDDPPARPRLLAEPGRGLLLRPPAQAAYPDDFGDLDSLAEQILAFEHHYNTTARPFDWRFTRTDLNQLLTRIARHDPFAPQPLAA